MVRAASSAGAAFSLSSLVSSWVLRSASVVHVVGAGAVDAIIVVLPSVSERRSRRRKFLFCVLSLPGGLLCVYIIIFVLSFELFAAF